MVQENKMIKSLKNLFVENDTYQIYEDRLANLSLHDFWKLDHIPNGVDQKMMIYITEEVKSAIEYFKERKEAVIDDNMTVHNLLLAHRVAQIS